MNYTSTWVYVSNVRYCHCNLGSGTIRVFTDQDHLTGNYVNSLLWTKRYHGVKFSLLEYSPYAFLKIWDELHKASITERFVALRYVTVRYQTALRGAS